MNTFSKIYCRTYQKIFYLAAFFLKFKEPEAISGAGSTKEVGKFLKNKNINNCLVITDNSIYNLGLLSSLEEGFKNVGINYQIYHDVVPNPTFTNVFEAKDIYEKNNCQLIIGFGGGSSMDTAKATAALLSHPNKTLSKMRGVLHVHSRKVPLLMVPTTAGTGSEVTIASVIIDDKNNFKYAINDPALIPEYVCFDPNLLTGLPLKVSSTTGIDALTHAVEAYIGHSNTRKTKKKALEAISIIINTLSNSCDNPKDVILREKMLHASYLAGQAFTRAYVGYVHAIAHSLGGKYNVPHGYANSIILPVMLEAYGKSIHKKLAEIYDYCYGYSNKNIEEKAESIISWIKKFNKSYGIPEKFDIAYDEGDVNEMVEHAAKEANPLYPVPVEFSKLELRSIYKKVLK